MNISPPEDRKRLKNVSTMLLEGLNSGDPIPVNAEFWTELKREALAKLEVHKKTGKVDRP